MFEVMSAVGVFEIDDQHTHEKISHFWQDLQGHSDICVRFLGLRGAKLTQIYMFQHANTHKQMTKML